MNRNYLNQYILDTYGVEPEYPWIKYPDYAVYRHQTNGKWFAVIMEIPRGKIGMEGNEIIPVANLKCDPLLIGSLVHEHGVFPGYHMNKEHWITACLDDSVHEDLLKGLLQMSYDLTRKK
ncbi:MAG: MmcQ/YjbR family DNA-binding protein [Clostridia bacterium]|nr:MmcQ/YjbR family DNA-binding protein [Clostridiales bacterium]MBQ6803452.1 MmcQ/YjbR family DNA-binding protein [Clostridia bacterium]